MHLVSNKISAAQDIVCQIACTAHVKTFLSAPRNILAVNCFLELTLHTTSTVSQF